MLTAILSWRTANGRARAMGDTSGFVKLIADAKRGVYASPELMLVRPLLELQARWSALPSGSCGSGRPISRSGTVSA